MNLSNNLIKTTALSFTFCLLFHYAVAQGVYTPVQICDSTTAYDNVPDDDPLPQLFDSNDFEEDLAMQWIGQYTGTAIASDGRNMQVPDINILKINYRSPNTIDIVYESFWGPVGGSEMGYDKGEIKSVVLTSMHVIKASKDDFKIAIVKDGLNNSLLRVLLIKTCGNGDDWKKRVFFLTASQGINNMGN